MLYLGKCPTVEDLKKEARRLKIKGYSSMNKNKLIEEIGKVYRMKEQKKTYKTYEAFVEPSYVPFKPR